MQLPSTDGSSISLATLVGRTILYVYSRGGGGAARAPVHAALGRSSEIAEALRLPTFTDAGKTILKRLTMVINDGFITHVFDPVFPADRNAAEIADWLKAG